jgi:hypothetical protein
MRHGVADGLQINLPVRMSPHGSRKIWRNGRKFPQERLTEKVDL